MELWERKKFLQRLIYLPVRGLICDPRVRRDDRVQDGIVLQEDVGVVDQALGNLGDLRTAHGEVVLQKFVLKKL